MMNLLENKNVIITGASRGIGEAIALKFAQQGANIAFTYRNSENKAKALEEKLTALGGKAKSRKSDAGNFSDCQTFVSEVINEFGSIDVCVNNAGISKDNLLLRLSEEQWDDVIGVNLKSVYNMTKHVIRPMMK